jgi:hypothetical protein
MEAEYVLHAVKGVKKSFDNAAAASILMYKDSRIFTFEDTTEWTEIFNSTESMDGAKELSETETPPTLTLDEGYQVSLSNKRFGGGIVITETDMEKAGDSTVLINKYIERKRNGLLRSNRNLFLTNIFKMLNEAFDSNSVYAAPDGVEICGDHLWATDGATGFTNKGTRALGATAIEELEEYGGAFVDAKGIPMPISFDTIVVKKGSKAAREAKKLFMLQGTSPITVGEINIYEGEYTLVETPYITAANKTSWFAFASTLENPLYVGIGKMPAMKNPIVTVNESVVSNATGFWKQGVNNLPFAVYGSTGLSSAS